LRNEASRGEAWPAALALASVCAYQANGHVLKYVGSLRSVDPITLVFLLHTVIALLAPLAYARRKIMREELQRLGISTQRFFCDVAVMTVLQMSINYFWLMSSRAVPTQLTSAIYQTAIGYVYLLSVLLLGERAKTSVMLGVLVALTGVILACLFPPLQAAAAPGSTAKAYDYPRGILTAHLALAAKVASQIFAKVELAGASPQLMGLFQIHSGLAHLYLVLPLMLLGNQWGLPDMSLAVDLKWPTIPALCLAAAVSTFVSYGYQTVSVVRSPLFLCSFQVLGVVIAVGLDYLLYRDQPQPQGYLGYALVLGSFLPISGFFEGPIAAVTKAKVA